MSQSEMEKIKAIIDDYRQYKIKFIQFVKLCELVISRERLLEIELKESNDASMLLKVLDAMVLIKFSMIFNFDNVPLGKVEFIKVDELDDRKHELVFSLYFNKLGNILESISDTFSNRRIYDEHDVPYVLHRFLQRYLHTLKLKEPAQDIKES